MTYTRADWSDALLTAIGNQHSTDYVRHWIESWTQWETTHPPGAAFNLLNTTESWKPDGTAYHATDFNSVVPMASRQTPRCCAMGAILNSCMRL